MRKLITSVVMVSGLLFVGNLTNSCSKVDELIDEISIPIPFTVPVSFDASFPFATVNTTDFLTYPEIPVNIDIDAKIKEQYPSFSADNLKSAKLDNFSIVAVDGNAVELDAIQDAQIFFKAPNQPDALIATVTGNTNKTTVNFTPTPDLQLINHLKSKQNSFYLKIKGSRIAAGNMKIKINAGFKIEVGL